MPGPDRESIADAARLLDEGGVVAFPTETFYGLGALMDEVSAVDRVYRMKGRPRTRALIVHIASAQVMPDFALSVPGYVEQLAEAFWPGPLTLLVRKRDRVPDEVTGGQDTVGLRVPADPTALELLHQTSARRGTAAGIAAPSACRFGDEPARSAEDVVASLGAAGSGSLSPDLILDAGGRHSELPSTVLRCVEQWPRVLRHGGVKVDEIESVIGRWVDS